MPKHKVVASHKLSLELLKEGGFRSQHQYDKWVAQVVAGVRNGLIRTNLKALSK